MDPAATSVEAAGMVEAIGWVPAAVFPIATGVQLLAILRSRSAEGVSLLAWSLFACANVSLYFYTEKHEELASILGTLGTAALNLCIVVTAIRYRKIARRNANTAARVE